MSEALKDVVRRINLCFESGDEQGILNCLTEDVVWHVPPHFTARGKEAFRQQISSPAADGPPTIDLRGLVAEQDCVAAEGYVTNRFKGGGLFRGLFHNVYRFRAGKVCQMTSYVVALPDTGWDSETALPI